MEQWKRKIEHYLEILNLIKFTLFLIFFLFVVFFFFLIVHSSKWNRAYED
jgi:exosortase/archaeosortase